MPPAIVSKEKKTYGLVRIYNPVIEMLNNLATVGIKFKNSTQGKNKVGALTVFTLNDNLGQNEAFELVESFICILLEIFSCEISEKARHGKKTEFLLFHMY